MGNLTDDTDADEVDGTVTMHELRDGNYEVTGHRLVSRLGDPVG